MNIKEFKWDERSHVNFLDAERNSLRNIFLRFIIEYLWDLDVNLLLPPNRFAPDELPPELATLPGGKRRERVLASFRRLDKSYRAHYNRRRGVSDNHGVTWSSFFDEEIFDEWTIVAFDGCDLEIK